jgi:hypothetical protein
MKHFLVVMFFAALTAPAAFAQKWEVGVGGGGGFYTSQTFANPVAGDADGKLASGFAVSGWLDNNIGEVLGGELRYDFQTGDLKLSSSGANVGFAAKTNAIHYDLVVHFAPPGSHVRPFIAAGAGVKIYSGTGSEQAFQPLSNIALLSKTRDTVPLISVGGGVKVALSKSAVLRLEVHDYLTTFPKKVIVPAEGSSVGGWLSDFVVMAGLGFSF